MGTFLPFCMKPTTTCQNLWISCHALKQEINQLRVLLLYWIGKCSGNNQISPLRLTKCITLNKLYIKFVLKSLNRVHRIVKPDIFRSFNARHSNILVSLFITLRLGLWNYVRSNCKMSCNVWSQVWGIVRCHVMYGPMSCVSSHVWGPVWPVFGAEGRGQQGIWNTITS